MSTHDTTRWIERVLKDHRGSPGTILKVLTSNAVFETSPSGNKYVCGVPRDQMRQKSVGRSGTGALSYHDNRFELKWLPRLTRNNGTEITARVVIGTRCSCHCTQFGDEIVCSSLPVSFRKLVFT